MPICLLLFLASELGERGRDASGRAGPERPGWCRRCIVADGNSLIESLAAHLVSPCAVRKVRGALCIGEDVVLFVPHKGIRNRFTCIDYSLKVALECKSSCFMYLQSRLISSQARLLESRRRGLRLRLRYHQSCRDS